MNKPIIAEIGKVNNVEELSPLQMSYIEVCIIQGRGMNPATRLMGTSYKQIITVRSRLYEIFDVKNETTLALALVNNGIIKLK